MAEVAFKGKPVHVGGMFPKVGSVAPPFELVCQDLSVKNLSSFGNQKKVLNIFVSLDTSVCSQSVHTFHKRLSQEPNLIVLNISMDLPFAAARFCKAEQLENVLTLSAFRNNFAEDYGVKILDGPLEGLCARALIVLGSDNKVLYSQLVSEITDQPDYQAAVDAVHELQR
ncbi:MAG: thiol peroxidase [Chlamydiales bacterium]